MRSWIESGSHRSKEDSKDGIHGKNFLTLLVMVAYRLIHPALERARHDLFRRTGNNCE